MARLAVLVVVASVVATAVGWGSGVPASAAPTPPCADVLVLGARGSGQPAADDPSPGGAGAQVDHVVNELRRRLSDRRVRTIAVRYPASSVAGLVQDPAGYLAGLEQGVAWTRGRIVREARRCPRQHVVLVGYSQGAMVMHRAVLDLIAAGATKEVGRIDGVVLIADGDRDAADGSRQWGTAGPGVGVARRMPALSGARTTVLPRSVARRVHSVCDRGDQVCDPAGALTWSGSTDVHTTHYLGSASMERVVANAVRRISSRQAGRR